MKPVFSLKQLAAFEEAVEPLVQFLRENGHPNMKVIVNDAGAEILTGLASTEVRFPDEDLVKAILDEVRKPAPTNRPRTSNDTRRQRRR